MGEDFPLDPNQVEPPQEGQADHHEADVQSDETAQSDDSQGSEFNENEQPTDGEPAHLDTVDHNEDGRIEDIDKARVVAEAGAKYRAMARAKSEYDIPAGKLRNQYKVRMDNRAYGAEGRGVSAKEMFEREAESVEQYTGEQYEEARSSSYSHDVEKAMRMMRAEGARKTNLAEKTPLEAGNQYDLERAEKELGISLADVLERTTEASDKAVTFLRFSHLIAEHYRKVGDDLSPSLEALDLAYKFTGGWGHKTLQEYSHNKWVQVAFDGDKNGAVSITKGAEKWQIPMFDDDAKGYRHTGTYARPRDFAYYELTKLESDPDGQFDRVQIRKTRSLGPADVANLQRVFGEVREYDAHKRENTLYPGDDGFAEALADINYGRDL